MEKIGKQYISPRQKMINLIYIVLMAMLALNVSADVLEGFTLVDSSIQRTTRQTLAKNESLYNDFERQYAANAAKAGQWFDKAMTVRKEAQKVCNMILEIKWLISSKADGSRADIAHLVNKDDKEAVTQVMLTRQWGDRLWTAISNYQMVMTDMAQGDSLRQKNISDNLACEAPADGTNRSWSQYYFENIPAAAAVTFLSKLENDIRYTEGEVLHMLYDNIDARDLRVNSLEALVIPRSETVVQGTPFQARIVMAAVDTTQQPTVFIGNKQVTLNDGIYTAACPHKGAYTLAGHLEIEGNGGIIRRPFLQHYNVVEPTATVAPILTSVLYAGYDNPVDVSVLGVPSADISVQVSGASCTKRGEGRYVMRPLRAGSECTVSVYAKSNGRERLMAAQTLKVRRMPEPSAYLAVADGKGGQMRYRGGVIERAALMGVTALHAAVDDGILDVPFRVSSFEMVFFDRMGNAIPMASEGAAFSQRQKDALSKLAKNRRCYISRIKAAGPDGTQRTVNGSMEIIIK